MQCTLLSKEACQRGPIGEAVALSDLRSAQLQGMLLCGAQHLLCQARRHLLRNAPRELGEVCPVGVGPRALQFALNASQRGVVTVS